MLVGNQRRRDFPMLHSGASGNRHRGMGLGMTLSL